MSSEIAINVNNLSKCYEVYDKPRDRLRQMFARKGEHFYREFWALRPLSLDIRRGETIGIIGGNGSGKSTLLQLICGTIAPTTGTVHTNGRIAALLELGSGFNLEFTGRENVYINGAILGLSQEDIDARFDEIAEFASIGDFIDQPIKTYSSGMVVRLAFAVSVCVEPDILVVDEALAVGDASFQFKCLDRLATLTESGTTLLFVSHDMSMVKRFCNKVVYLRQGEVRGCGPADEMAELYLLDMRDDQRRWATGGGVQVVQKNFLDNQKGIAFGTDEGHIVSACFLNTQDLYSNYLYGEEVQIRVEVALSKSVDQPNISFTIQEPRLLVIGGGNFPLQAVDSGDARTASITIRFKARLNGGRYHVTLKILNGFSEETSQLIEKQVALLAFDMMPNSAKFLGIVDLGIEPMQDQPQLHDERRAGDTSQTPTITQNEGE